MNAAARKIGTAILEMVVSAAAAWGASGPDTLWTRTYGGPSWDFGFSVQQTPDGGYVFVGQTESFGAGNQDVYLIRTDADGLRHRTRTYGGAGRDRGIALLCAPGGGYVLVGETYSLGAGGSDVYFVRTDEDGDTLWTRTYGSQDYETGQSVALTSDGGYVIAGFRTRLLPSGLTDIDVYLVRTDEVGDTLWTRSHGGPEYDMGYSVLQTSDGGYIVVGNTASWGAGETDVLLIRTNANGDTLWTRTYGGADHDHGASALQAADGGYLIAGSTHSFGAGQSDVYLVRTDANGDPLWTRTYGGPDYDFASSIQPGSAGGYVIAGGARWYGSRTGDVYLLRTDAAGDTVWTGTYGGPGQESADGVAVTTDGGYVLVGATDSFGAGQADVYLLRTGDDLWDAPTDPFAAGNERFLRLRIWPNPAEENVSASFYLEEAGFVRLWAVHPSGRGAGELIMSPLEAGMHTIHWDLASGGGVRVRPGLYVCRLHAGPRHASARIVISY